MSTANHYKSNLRDVSFNLFEVLKIQDKYLGHGPYQGLDEAAASEILSTFEKFCTQELSQSFVESDRVPLELDNAGNVTLMPGLKSAISKLFEGGWTKLELREELGGMAAPATLAWAAYEFGCGANPACAFYTSMNPMVVRVLDSCATPEQKKRFVPNMLERNWGGTMVLTEPDAGSDVGAGRTKATHVVGDEYHIEGVKRFITNGDFDYPENIVHLVLARTEGAVPGTKGLSLFIVPKFWVNEDGSLGERNGAVCTNLEKKMGIKGSATCEMTFGGHGKKPARGLLVGNVHDGIRQMFLMIEHARMAVGCKSMATLSTGYLNALNYAKLRVQGPDMTKMQDKASPRVRIIQHPDVKRSLLELKAHSEGMRALVLYTAATRDEVELAHAAFKASGKLEHSELAARWDLVNDMLLPLVKGYCSDRSFALLGNALQIFGGSGYCQDYPLEQYIRDQKIDTLYEGTTHIQSLDLLFRKILRDKGATLKFVLSAAGTFLKEEKGGEPLRSERACLAKAMADLEATLGMLQGKMQESIYHAGFQANRILQILSETVIGWLLLEQAAVATQKINTTNSAEKAFYEGKVASCRYFCQEVLPNVTLVKKLVENGSLWMMDVKEESY